MNQQASCTSSAPFTMTRSAGKPASPGRCRFGRRFGWNIRHAERTANPAATNSGAIVITHMTSISTVRIFIARRELSWPIRSPPDCRFMNN
jgi:hypothetical protein